MAVVIFPRVEVCRLQQLEIGESPYLIGYAGKDIVRVHRRVRGHDPVQFRKYDQAVRRKQGIGKRRVRIAAGANHLALIVNLHQTAARAHAPFTPPVMRVLEGGEHVAVG